MDFKAEIERVLKQNMKATFFTVVEKKDNRYMVLIATKEENFFFDVNEKKVFTFLWELQDVVKDKILETK